MVDDQFIKKPFSFYDSGVLPVFGPMLFTAYEMLRRFTWRSTKSGHREVRDMVRGGLVVARISQTKLGDKLGLGRPKLNGYIQRMKALGWINLIEVEEGQVPVYQLGERVQDSKGCEHEVFFADAWLQRVCAMLDEEACRLYGEVTWDEQDTTAGDAVSEAQRIKVSLQRLTGAESAAAIRRFVPSEAITRQARGVSPKGDTSTSVQVFPKGNRGCSQKGTGGVPKREQVNREGLEVENDIEFQKSPLTPQGEGGDQQVSERSEALAPSSPPNPPHRSSPSEPPPSTSARPLTPAPTALEPSGLSGTRGRTPKSVATYLTLAERRRNIPPGTALRSADLAGMRATVAQEEEKAQRRRDQQIERSRAKQQKQANLNGKKVTLGERQQIDRLKAVWTEGLQERWPKIQFKRWGKRENGQCRELLEGHTLAVVEQTFRYVLESWEEVQREVLKRKALDPKETPSLRLVVKLIDMLAPRAQQHQDTAGVREEYEQWFRDNPTTPAPPELKRRYMEATGKR